jgi:ubiquinone/menaquinone biosynthesis C-methylase UbiE
MSGIPQSASQQETELERIRTEYRRRALEIPHDFYRWNRPVNLYIQCQLMRDAIAMLDRAGLFPLDGRSIADIGCGSGTWLLEFAQWGSDVASLSGIDLDGKRVDRARAVLPGADLHSGSAAHLPWADGTQDMVTQFTLFSSILSSELKQTVAAEMLRVLRPNGFVLWYDLRFDNPKNPNVRAIGVPEIHKLFPNCKVTVQKVTLAPPIARAVVPHSWILAAALEKLPFLRTHHLMLIQKPAAAN